MRSLMVKCEGCQEQFVWEPGKKYHSVECRKRHYLAEHKNQEKELWAAEEYHYPEELRRADEAGKFAGVMGLMAATGTFFYRLGCPRQIAKTLLLRWFPVAGGSRDYFSARPLQSPSPLPLPGLYLVALFDERKRLIATPSFKLPIATFTTGMRWHIGSKAC